MSTFETVAVAEAPRSNLLDHLIELRGRLIVCVVALAVGFGICFAFSEQIYVILLRPFEVAAQLLAAQKLAGAHQGFDWSRPVASAWTHLASTRDLVLTLLGWKDLPVGAAEPLKLIFTAPLEFFFTKLKLAGFGAVVLTFPVLAAQVHGFVAPGLYRRERQAFVPFLIATPLLFALGAALVYFLILPFILWFSLSQQVTDGGAISIALMPKVSDYLTLATTLLLAFGLCFQLPVILSLLGMGGFISASSLRTGRRYAIVGIFVAAAILTPPDPVSQTLLAAPLLLLYEIAIVCVRMIEGRRMRDNQIRDTPLGTEP